MVGKRLAYAGGGFVLLTSLMASGGSLLSLPFALWACAPYAALWGFAHKTERSGPVLGAGLAGLTGEAAIRAAVFLWPENSTAAVALAFSPAYILVILMPAGAGLGYVFGELWLAAKTPLRASLALISAGALIFEFFAIAAPEKLPMNAAKTRAALARIGEPRVVVPGTLESVLVSTASAWHQVVDFDGKPGDELAFIDHRGVRFVDVVSFRETYAEPFPGEPGRLWSWMSQLVPMEDGLAVVQTGGGFSETRVQRLDGSLLWDYKPDVNLKPTALVPADLEDDHHFEFYAASNESVARLDTDGRLIWAQPARSAQLLGVLPEKGEQPAWVAALEYGRRAIVWGADGRRLGEHAVTPKAMPFAVADTPWGRAFLCGGKNKPLRIVGLDGRELFSVPLGDFTAIQAVGLDLKSGPALAVSADTPKNIGRARLFIVGAGGKVLYDEILAKLPVLRAARLPGKTSILLLSRDGLRVLRAKS